MQFQSVLQADADYPFRQRAKRALQRQEKTIPALRCSCSWLFVQNRMQVGAVGSKPVWLLGLLMCDFKILVVFSFRSPLCAAFVRYHSECSSIRCSRAGVSQIWPGRVVMENVFRGIINRERCSAGTLAFYAFFQEKKCVSVNLFGRLGAKMEGVCFWQKLNGSCWWSKGNNLIFNFR